VLQALAVLVETEVLVEMAVQAVAFRLRVQQKLVMVEPVEPVGLAEQAAKEAMARMELAKQCSLFMGIHC
jgi:hypothetical protein